MTQVSKGRIRFSSDDPWLQNLKTQKGASAFVEHDGWIYFLATPFDSEPWTAFDDAVPRPLQLPAGFHEIFGDRPSLPGAAVGWDQELGLWRDNKRPDWVDDGTAFVAQKVFEHYGTNVGDTKDQWRLMPYRLTNGAELVFCPDADKRGATRQAPNGLVLDARLVYQYPIYGLTGYQGDLLQAGVVIPENKLVEFLKYGKIEHRLAG